MRMPGKQKDITQFFGPKSKKHCEPEEEGSDVKKRRISPSPPLMASKLPHEDSCSLTTEQKERMSTNKILAKIKVSSKSFPHALHHSIGPSWFAALESEFSKPYFKKLNDYLGKERDSATKIFPPEDEVWSWTHHFPIEGTKVVILGQDPYHGINQAHGLCFSVKRPVPPPPSLVNMFKELEADVPGFVRPNHGCLLGWAKQGVLLLNACLTVRQAQANSHKDKGWETLTNAVVKHISEHCTGVVFLLWGAYAQKKADIVDKRRHHLLKSVHPSPLSAHRGFLGCRHFSKCNEILQSQGKNPIDWGKLDD